MSESNIQQNMGKTNDEIDLFEFCSRMWKAFVSFLTEIKDLFVSFIIFLIRKSLWILSFGMAGMLIGFLLIEISQPFFTFALEGNTSGIYDPDEKKYSGGVDNTVVIDHINKLGQVKHNPELLASYLDLQVEQVQAIRSINAYYGIDINKDMKPDYVDINETYNPKDTAKQFRVPSFIHIRVSVYDESILPALRKGLFKYINSNAFIQELYQVDKRQKEETIQEIEKEIIKVNDFQQARIRKESSMDQGSFVLLGNEPEPRLFYQDILRLHRQKQALEKYLELSNEIIIVIQDFTPIENEERSVKKYIIILGSALAVMGLFCSLLWQYRKRILELIREDSTNR